MTQQYVKKSVEIPYNLVSMVRQVERAIATGFRFDDADAVAQLARQMECSMLPRIVPDRRYTIREIEQQFGFARSSLYKHHRSVIRKDGRKSYVAGHDLLEVIHRAPALAPAPTAPAMVKANPVVPRRRGAPRKLTLSPPTAMPPTTD